MARGYPDFSPGAARSPQDTFLPFIALAPVWFHDDFESPILKWGAALGVCVLDSSPAVGAAESPVYHGSTCLKCTASLGGGAFYYRYIGIPPIVNNIGIAMIFRLGTLTDYHATAENALRFVYHQNSGARAQEASINYNPNTGIWYITEDSGTIWIPILTYKVRINSSHYVKLIFNVATLKYVAAYIDQHIIDLRAYNLDDFLWPSDSSLYLYLYQLSSAANQALMYIDDFQVTYGES